MFVGRRELGHFHRSGRLDLPLPVEIGDNLVRRGVIEAHASHVKNGWYSAAVKEKEHPHLGLAAPNGSPPALLSRRGEKIRSRRAKWMYLQHRRIALTRAATARWEHPERRLPN